MTGKDGSSGGGKKLSGFEYILLMGLDVDYKRKGRLKDDSEGFGMSNSMF